MPLALLAGVLAAIPGPAVNLTNDPLTSDTAPSWSPDGSRIAFARGGDQDGGLPLHIHTVSLATGRTSRVTSGRVQDLLPSWQTL